MLVATYSTKGDGVFRRVHNVKTASDFINGRSCSRARSFPPTIAWARAPLRPYGAQGAGHLGGGCMSDELGGGIRQVSSYAVQRRGPRRPEITSWAHHSWPSSYVPIGATPPSPTGGP